MSQVATRSKSPSVFTPLLVLNSFPCYGASIYQLNAQNMLFSTRSDRNNLLVLKQVVNIKTVLIMHQIHRLVRRFNFGGLTTPARFFFPLEIRCKEFYNFPTVPGNIDLRASSPWEYCPANKRPSRRGHGATFVFSWSLARRVHSSRSEKRARRRRLSYSH